jgi:hypothetical protein
VLLIGDAGVGVDAVCDVVGLTVHEEAALYVEEGGRDLGHEKQRRERASNIK